MICEFGCDSRNDVIPSVTSDGVSPDDGDDVTEGTRTTASWAFIFRYDVSFVFVDGLGLATYRKMYKMDSSN